MTKEVIQDEEPDIRAIGVINLLLGAWLIITPFWFDYTSTAARWDQVIIGLVVMALAGLRTLLPEARWMSVITGLAGLWAVIAPFILSYNRSIAYWNEVIVGALIAFLAFYNSGMSAEGRTRHKEV